MESEATSNAYEANPLVKSEIKNSRIIVTVGGVSYTEVVERTPTTPTKPFDEEQQPPLNESSSKNAPQP